METEGSSIQDNEEEQTHSMENVLEDQLEDLIDERENVQSGNIHAENIYMENHVEPPVIQQEIEEGRPNRQRTQPRHFSEYQVKLSPSIDHTQSTSDQESSTKEAMRKEIHALEKNRTWTLEQLPKGKKAIDSKWVYKIKLKLNDLEKEVYMKIPQGFSTKYETRVCKLKRSIYGLKQASQNWYHKFTKALIGLDYKQSKADHSLFIYKNGDTYVAALIYVDDVILVGNDKKWIERTKSHMDKEFSIKDLGPLKYFLGIEVAKTSKGLVLSQYKYTLDILQGSGLQGCRPSSFPMEPNLKLDKGEEEEKIDASRYRRLVGILLPNTTVTDLLAYCDADWLGCPLSRRSRSGYVLLLGGALISWNPKKQLVVSRSSAEAEYRSMATAVSEITWVRWLLKELDVAVVGPTPLFCDNEAAKHIANNPAFHERTKHVEMDCYFGHERVERKEIMHVHINLKQQIADLLTKPLGAHLLQMLLVKLGIRNLHAPN
ncbi:putative reverse transcriptase, RNA-dependent DNA polymerase, LTR copia-type gag-polypeptide [Tanacetum coccineum]